MGSSESKGALLERARDPATPPADRIRSLLVLTYDELDDVAQCRREYEEQRRRASERHSLALVQLNKVNDERQRIDNWVQSTHLRTTLLEKRLQGLKALEQTPPAEDDALASAIDGLLAPGPVPTEADAESSDGLVDV